LGEWCPPGKTNHFSGTVRTLTNVLIVKNEEQFGHSHLLKRVPGINGVSETVYKSKVFGFTTIGQYPEKRTRENPFGRICWRNIPIKSVPFTVRSFSSPPSA